MSAPTVDPLAAPNPATTNWVPVNGPVGNLGGGFEFGYDQITADVTVSSTMESAGNTVIACAPHTFDGNPVIAEFYSTGVQPAQVNGGTVIICLFEGSTEISRLATVITPAAAAMRVAVNPRVRFTPSAGSHTYTVTAYAGAGNGVIQAGAGGAGASPPAFVRFSSVAYYTGPGAGIPSPIVNGQWVKGVGGAAVWSPLAAYGTSLPASPLDGDEAVLVDSVTNPTYQWRFRYNAGNTTAYKWEFVGGLPAQAGFQGSDTFAVGASTDTALPSFTGGITIPRNGVYSILFGSYVQNRTNTGASDLYLNAYVGALNSGYIGRADVTTTGQYGAASIASLTPAFTLTAAQVVRLSLYCGGAITAQTQNPWIQVVPARVA